MVTSFPFHARLPALLSQAMIINGRRMNYSPGWRFRLLVHETPGRDVASGLGAEIPEHAGGVPYFALPLACY